jgi:hypothetical protein
MVLFGSTPACNRAPRSSSGELKKPFTLDYDQSIHLDAEALAETGIREAYERLLPKLRMYVSKPAQLEEEIDNDTPRYSVRCGPKRYAIYGPELDEAEEGSWGRATFAFFRIVNDQINGSGYGFFAINGGNDLFGIFLTPAQAKAAQEALPRRTNWPYLPTDEPPWYGKYH